MTRNCSNEFPHTEVIYEELRTDTAVLVITGVVAVFTFLTILLFGEEVYFLVVNYKNSQNRQKIIVLLALYPVVSFTSLLCILVPTSTVIGEFVASIYLSYCIFLFTHLTISYFGGQSSVLDEYAEKTISFRTPPCCCCFVCLSKVPMTRKTLMVIKLMVLQVAILRPIVLFIAAVLWTDGKYEIGGQTDFSTSEAYISILNGISTPLAMYGMIVIYRATSDKLKYYNLRLKFVCIQLCVIIVNLQNVIFSILGQNGIPYCSQSRGSVVRSSRANHFLLILEMLLLAILARYAYRRTEDNYDLTLEPESVEEGKISYGTMKSVVSPSQGTETSNTNVISLPTESHLSVGGSNMQQPACGVSNLGFESHALAEVHGR